MTFPIGFWYTEGGLKIEEHVRLLDTLVLVKEDRGSESLYLVDVLSVVKTPRTLIINLAEYLRVSDLATLVKHIAVAEQLRLWDSISVVTSERIVNHYLAEYLKFEEDVVLIETGGQLDPPTDLIADFTPFEIDFADLDWVLGDITADTVIERSKNGGGWIPIAESPLAPGVNSVDRTDMTGMPGDMFQWRAKHTKMGFIDSDYCYSNTLEHV